jgi:hypothetical protein
VFSLFDTLLLLSKGRVIYSGLASKASAFFLENSPTLALVSGGYTNPADFLADVSGCMIKNKYVMAFSILNALF